MRLTTSYTHHKPLLLVVALFGIIYCLISLVNHYNFRTYALDLGAYTNALYDYIHFQWNDSTVFQVAKENLLADHFDLYLPLLSPFSLLLKTYTLLVAQLFFILLGGIGIYKYFSLSEKTQQLALYAAIYFYLFFGVFSAVSYDYHSNVIAAALVPWFFYFMRQKRITAASLLLLLVLVSKENSSLWAAFICLGLAIEYRNDSYIRNYLFIAFIFCIAYFQLVTSWVMPSLSNNFTYPHFHYLYLGSTTAQAVWHLLTHPVDSFETLFTNHNGSLHGDYVKAELHLLIVLSGLPFLLRKPQYILMLIPIYFQKLFNDNYVMWGIGGQYNIEFAPILAIGVFTAISEFKKQRLIKLTTLAVLATTLIGTIRTMDRTVFFTNKANIRFYQADHYTRDYDVSNVHQTLATLPADAIVSTQSPYLAQLSYRDNIYQFPIIKDAEYIVYSEKESPYPMTKIEFDSLTSVLENSREWNKIVNTEELTILKSSVGVSN